MKHSLTALLLTLALFCCLLTGCGPTPDVPGGSGGSNGSSSGSTNSGTEPDDSNSGGVSAPKLQPSIVMESFSAYHDAAGEDVARCVFRATNPNTAYSVSRARVDLTLKDAAGNVQETTYFMLQTIAPGDTVRFAYTYKCKKGVPASAAHTAQHDRFQLPAFCGECPFFRPSCCRNGPFHDFRAELYGHFRHGAQSEQIHLQPHPCIGHSEKERQSRFF